MNRLEALSREVGGNCLVPRVDLGDVDNGRSTLGAILAALGSVDLCVITAGVGFLISELDWTQERTTIEVNSLGFAAAATLVLDTMIARGTGTLVGVSSVAAARGSGAAGVFRDEGVCLPLPSMDFARAPAGDPPG